MKEDKIDFYFIRIEELQLEIEQTKYRSTHFKIEKEYVDKDLFIKYINSMISLFSQILSSSNQILIKLKNVDYSNTYSNFKYVKSHYQSIKYEYDNGLLNIRENIQEEIFDDFLEMGEHLLRQNFLAASAVIIGGVLEEKIRTLSEGNSIDTYDSTNGKFKEFNTLCEELRKIDVINKSHHKELISKYDIRNRAAHLSKDNPVQKYEVEGLLITTKNIFNNIL